MKRTANKRAAHTVQINNDVYAVRLSDCEIYAEGKKILAECVLLNVCDAEAVRKVLGHIAEFVDSALGAGAMRRIADGRPVGMTLALNTLNAIVEQSAARYAEYVSREYLPKAVGKNAKIQPVQP